MAVETRAFWISATCFKRWLTFLFPGMSANEVTSILIAFFSLGIYSSSWSKIIIGTIKRSPSRPSTSPKVTATVLKKQALSEIQEEISAHP